MGVDSLILSQTLKDLLGDEWIPVREFASFKMGADAIFRRSMNIQPKEVRRELNPRSHGLRIPG